MRYLVNCDIPLVLLVHFKTTAHHTTIMHMERPGRVRLARRTPDRTRDFAAHTYWPWMPLQPHPHDSPRSPSKAGQAAPNVGGCAIALPIEAKANILGGVRGGNCVPRPARQRRGLVAAVVGRAEAAAVWTGCILGANPALAGRTTQADVRAGLGRRLTAAQLVDQLLTKVRHVQNPRADEVAPVPACIENV